MNAFKNESGQVLVLTALSVTLLMGFMGLAADVGTLFHARRNLQSAVDAAATAGALAYRADTMSNTSSSTTTTDVQNAAKNAAVENGVSSNVTVTSAFPASVTSPTLYVASPPSDGPNTGTPGFVEAILTVPQPTFFLVLFGTPSMNVTTRAVAAPGGPTTNCVWVLDRTDPETMYMGGRFSVQAPKCGVIVNSSDPCAMYFNGTAGSLSAGYIAVHGGACNEVQDSTPTPVQGAPVVADPLANYVTWPTVPCTAVDTTTTTISSTTPMTFTPIGGAGNITCFQNTVTVSGPSINTSSSNPCGTATNPHFNFLVLDSGIYVFEKGVMFKGGCIGSGSNGTTFDLYGNTSSGASVSVSTLTYFDLFPPTNASEDNNILLMQPPSNSSGQIQLNQGTAYGTISGYIYCPTCQLSLTDNGSSSAGTLTFQLNANLVVNTLNDQAASMQVNGYTPSASGSKIVTKVILAE